MKTTLTLLTFLLLAPLAALIAVAAVDGQASLSFFTRVTRTR
jgi:hypothetical protein